MFPMKAPRSRPLADRSRRLLHHHLADDTDDRHQHPATNPTARDASWSNLKGALQAHQAVLTLLEAPETFIRGRQSGTERDVA